MSRISLPSVGNQLQVSRGNALTNSFIISHHGLSMFSLPLEIGTLLSFNLLILESPFQKIQKLYNNIHLRLCSSRITFVIKIQLKLEMLRPGLELCFIVLHTGCFFFFFFNHLKICNDSTNPTSSKRITWHFSKSIVHFVSLCHILVILTYFSLFLYLLWKSVIFDSNII